LCHRGSAPVTVDEGVENARDKPGPGPIEREEKKKRNRDDESQGNTASMCEKTTKLNRRRTSKTRVRQCKSGKGGTSRKTPGGARKRVGIFKKAPFADEEQKLVGLHNEKKTTIDFRGAVPREDKATRHVQTIYAGAEKKKTNRQKTPGP